MQKRKGLRYISFFLLWGLVLGFSPIGFAQDWESTCEETPGPAAPEPRVIMANEWTTGTGSDLDSCYYRSSLSDGSIDFTINIDQAISQPTAYLTLSTYDVDNPAAPGSCSGGSEIDKVYLNGHYLGTLTGASDTWSINSFSFPTTYLTAPGSNAIKVDVDTTVTGCWCVKVDYGTISLSGTYQSGVSLVSCTDRPEDTDLDGKYDRLYIDVTVNATAGGSFNLNGALYSASGNEIGWASTTKTLAAGNNTVTLQFNGEDINCRLANGPYTLRNVTVYNTSDTNIRAFTPQLCSTGSYTYGQFETCTSTCPLVISTSPVDGATGVSTSTTVSATFNVAMDQATLTTSTFTLTSGSSPMPVGGTVSYNSTTKTATFTPSGALAASTVYTATLTTGVKSQGFAGPGCALANAYVWSFTTAGGSSGGAGYCYYIPRFKDGAGASGETFWSGVGLSNSNASQSANVGVTIYSTTGAVIGSNSQTIAARGQWVSLIGSGLNNEGWTLVCSDQILTGLCFVGTTINSWYNCMADIPVATKKMTSLTVPHVAQNANFDTTFYICNPNNSATSVTLTYVAPGGTPSGPQSYSIPAMGSTSVALTTLLGGATATGGKVEISATQGVAAFALYNNLKIGGRSYAGIAAVDPSVAGEACTCPATGGGTGSLEVTVTSATTGAALPGATVAVSGQSGTTNSSGVYTFTSVSAGTVSLTTSLSGYSSDTRQVTITAGQTTQVTVSLSPQLATGEIRFVLNWGATPSDLDSHLTGPPETGTTRFHVYYSNRAPSGAGANLDHDDTTSYGPETVTITQRRAGTYKYYVHDYSNRSSSTSNAMSQSGAVVQVYNSAGLVATYNVPNQAGTLWYVCDLDGSTGALSSKNVMSFESSPTGPSIQAMGAEVDLFKNLPEK